MVEKTKRLIGMRISTSEGEYHILFKVFGIEPKKDGVCVAEALAGAKRMMIEGVPVQSDNDGTILLLRPHRIELNWVVVNEDTGTADVVKIDQVPRVVLDVHSSSGNIIKTEVCEKEMMMMSSDMFGVPEKVR